MCFPVRSSINSLMFADKKQVGARFMNVYYITKSVENGKEFK